jgi:hypothetical protein
MKRIAREYRRLASSPIEFRTLLAANAIYTLVLQVIEIFVAAYVLHESHQAVKVILYQLAIYAATPVTFLVKGYLLRWIAANKLYGAGTLCSGGALFILMSYSVTTSADIVLSGAMIMAKPLIDLGYYPMQFHVVDVVAGLEKRAAYAYLFNHELGTFLARASACLWFTLSG